MRVVATAILFSLTLAFPFAGQATNPVVRFSTPVGSWDAELCESVALPRCPQAAPKTVANFLSFVDSGAYEGSFIHRSINFPNPFVIQGGGFRLPSLDSVSEAVETNGVTVDNEFNQSNLRGTISVPLFGNGPTACDTDENSGSSGWLVNLTDNFFLDCGLFTVFGVVIEPGMEVVDTINLLTTLNLGPPFTDLPIADEFVCLPNQFGACTSDPRPFLIFTDITRVPEPAAGLGGATALMALAALARRPRTA